MWSACATPGLPAASDLPLNITASAAKEGGSRQEEPETMNLRRTTTMLKALTMTLLSTMLAVGAFAIAGPQPTAAINVGAELPPKLRILLIQEMRAIDEASQQIHSAIVQGQHETIANKAQAIHDSFIMEQQMTPADEAALLAAVPKAFLASDEELHELSAKLAEAGRARDTARQMQLFSEMTKGCVSCHSAYATARFPGLGSGNP